MTTTQSQAVAAPARAEDDPPPAHVPRWLPPLVYVVAVAVLIGPSLVGARVPVPHDLLLERLPWRDVVDDVESVNHELRDVVDVYHPVQRHLWQELRTGGDPTWIRDVSMGMPGAQFIGWGALSPFNWPALVLPFDLAWSWAMGLRLLVAMAGAHVLVRSYGVSRLGAMVAGVSFGLCGYMVLWLGWPQSHVGAWIPWVCWAARRTAGADPPWWGLPAVASTTAAMWLGGFPAVAVYALLAAAAVAVHAAWPRRADGWAATLRGVAAAGCGAALGTGLVGFTLLPSVWFLDALELGFREHAWQARVVPEALYTFLAPGVFGDVVHQPWWLPRARVESVGYAGVVTLALAVVAWVVSPRRRGLGLWTAIGLAACAAAYGAPPVRWVVSTLPLLSTNPPPRALALVGLAIAVGGAFGADAVTRALAGRAGVSRRDRMVVAGGGAVALLALAALRPVRHLRAVAVEALGDAEVIGEANDAALTSLLQAAGLLLAAALVVVAAVVLARRGHLTAGGRLLAGGVAVVVVVDLLAFAAGWNVQVRPDALDAEVPVLEAVAAESPEHRVAGSDDIGVPNAHLTGGFADLRSHTFLSARQREVLRRMGATFRSATRWDLAVHRSAGWEPWLSAASVAAVMVPAPQRAVPSPLPPLGEEDAPGRPLAAFDVAVQAVEVERSGTLAGIDLRVGTFDRRNRGTLTATLVADGEVRSRGTLLLSRLADNAPATVPVHPAPVEAGEELLVVLTVESPSEADGIALYGDPRDGPTVGLRYADDEPWPASLFGSVWLLHNPDALPRVYAVADAEVVPAGEAVDAVEQLGADRLDEVVVLDSVAHLPDPPAGGQARVEDWGAEGGEIRATVTSDTGAVLVATEAAFDGWTATVSGQDVPVVTANHLFVGVVVPPGTHEVVLHHRSPGTVAGLGISAAALLGLAALSLLARRRAPRC